MFNAIIRASLPALLHMIVPFPFECFGSRTRNFGKLPYLSDRFECVSLG